jgi:hypothetical protein
MSPIPLGILAASGVMELGSYDLLATEILTSSAASVTFSSLGDYAADYQHLQIRSVMRSDKGSANRTSAGLRLNADSGSNYSTHHLHATGSSVVSTAYTSTTFMQNLLGLGSIPTTSNVSNAYGVAILDILDPFETSKYTTVRCLHGSSQTDPRLSLASGLWRNSASLTSIEIAPNEAAFLDSNFVSGSRFSLYGIKAV